MTFILIPTSVALVVFIWLDTNAFIDYFGGALRKISETVDKYMAELENGSPVASSLTFPLWWNLEMDSNFITRLLSCPICCCIWINILIGVFLWPIYIITFSFLSIVAYYILRILFTFNKTFHL